MGRAGFRPQTARRGDVMNARPHHFAYVFERFPTFTQTFCVREVLEIGRLGLRPMIFSIRDTRDERVSSEGEDLKETVHYLPQGDALVETVKAWKRDDRLPQEIVLTLRHWGNRPDKRRVWEAAYIGMMMREAGVRHAHSHFAGIGARACWWLRFFWNATYSFTGHANDLFCEPEGAGLDLATLVRDASRVVTVSDFTAAWLRERFPRSAGRVRRVYNGLDFGPFDRLGFEEARRRRGTGHRPVVITSVGRLIEKKGFDTLIAACRLLADRGLGFRCEIIGEGPLEAPLRTRIDELGLEGQVELVGPLPSDAVRGRLMAADIFALACATEADGGRDNLPTVLMEAMAAELPCVSTRLAGVPEMVRDGSTGRLVEEGDPGELAEALAGLIDDPAERVRMGTAGRAFARRVFSKEVTAPQLADAILAGGRVARDDELARRSPVLRRAWRRQWPARLRRTLGLERRRTAPIVPPEVRLS